MAGQVQVEAEDNAPWWTAVCGQVAVERPHNFAYKRRPKCNRPWWHDGEHIEYERHTFAILHRWPA